MAEMNNSGEIRIADEVVEIIAATAAREVAGVAAPAGGSGLFGKKGRDKSVKLTIEETVVEVEMDITVRFGCKVLEVAEQVQEKVKNAIETMTNYTVVVVNVNVCGIVTETAEA